MTHEEFIAAGYECRETGYAGIYTKQLDEIGGCAAELIYTVNVWEIECGDFSATLPRFNSIPEAETVARRIYAALNDNPAATALLAFLENVSFDDIAYFQDVVVKSEEMAELLAAAKAEIGGAV